MRTGWAFRKVGTSLLEPFRFEEDREGCQDQQQIVDYVGEENRVLRAQILALRLGWTITSDDAWQSGQRP